MWRCREALSVLSWMCYKERIWESNEASFVSNPCRWTFSLDVLQLRLTESGNRYLLVFVDYLTKCVEAFPIQDQSAETI